MSPRKKSAIKKIARTAYIPEPLHEQLSKVAEETGVSANDLIILALRQFLNAPPATPPPADDDVAGFED